MEQREYAEFAGAHAAATLNFGITITNVIVSGLLEFLFRFRRDRLYEAIRGTIYFSVLAGVVAVALSVLSLTVWPSAEINNPESAAKQIYWSAASYDAAQRQGVTGVAWEFAATSFVAPALARYPSGLPSNPYLWDFRGQSYGSVGWVAVLGWLALFAFGAVKASEDRARWPMWLLCAAWIGFNVVLHTYWQFRGSVFLYAAHSHIAFLAIALAGASRTSFCVLTPLWL